MMEEEGREGDRGRGQKAGEEGGELSARVQVPL